MLGGIGTHYWIDKSAAPTTIAIHDTAAAKPAELKIVKVTKPLSLKQVDSLYEVAKKFWLSKIDTSHVTILDTLHVGLYADSKETTYSDSALIAHTEIRSRIPIDPELEWYFDYTIKPKTVMSPKSLSFWDRLGHGPEIGLGFGMFNKKIDMFIGYGFHYKIN